MNKFGNNPYELPTNTDIEKVLNKNLDTINPVEMKEITNTNGGKTLFPFWTPVKDAGGISFTDYKKYLSGREKVLDIKAKKDNVGIVQPKDASKTYEETSIIDKINSVIEKHNNAKLFDNTGIVKAVSTAMDKTKTNKQIIDNEVGETKEVKVEKAAKDEPGKVGCVKPKSENMPSKTATQVIKTDTTNKPEVDTAKIKGNVGINKNTPQIKVDITSTSKKSSGEKVGAVKPKADMGKQTKVDVASDAKKATGEKVGAVKPKAEAMPSETKEQVTNNKVDKPAKVEVEKAGKSETGVGAVKPKADMGKQSTVGEINFDKYKTDHISKPTK